MKGIAPFTSGAKVKHLILPRTPPETSPILPTGKSYKLARVNSLGHPQEKYRAFKVDPVAHLPEKRVVL